MRKEEGHRGSGQDRAGGLNSMGGPPEIKTGPDAAAYHGDPYRSTFPLPGAAGPAGERAEASLIDPAEVLPEIDPSRPNTVGLVLDKMGGGQVEVEQGVERAPAGLAEQAVGRDDRDVLAEDLVGTWPYSALCHFIIDWPHKSQESGTGWLVTPRLAVTAGHCVYDYAARRPARRIEVNVGRHAGRALSRQASAEFIWADRLSRAGATTEQYYDYGAVVLPQPVPGAGAFGFHAYSSGELIGKTVNVVGYPGDVPDWSNPNRGKWRFGDLWGHAAAVSHVDQTSRIVYYTVDTSPGQSGAPVFRLVNYQGRMYCISVGIHSSGFDDAWGRQFNQAVWINHEVSATVQEWMRSIG